MTSVPIKGVNLATDAHIEKARQSQRQRLGDASINQGMPKADSRPQKPGESPGTNSPSSPASEGVNLAITSILDLQPLERSQYTSVASAAQLAVAGSDGSGALTHTQ